MVSTRARPGLAPTTAEDSNDPASGTAATGQQRRSSRKAGSVPSKQAVVNPAHQAAQAPETVISGEEAPTIVQFAPETAPALTTQQWPPHQGNTGVSTSHTQNQQDVDGTSSSDDGEDMLAKLERIFRSRLQTGSADVPSTSTPAPARTAPLQSPASTSAPAPELIPLGARDSPEQLDADLAELRWEPQVVASGSTSWRTATLTADTVTKEKGLAKQLVVPPRDARKLAKQARKQQPDTAGHKWYDMPATKITDDVKRDLRLLRLRGAFDPKRFYKSFDKGKLPKHFQIGTVVEPASEFYSSRLARRERKGTLTEELLVDAHLSGSRKKRYNQLQEDAQRWTKHKKRKTDLPRENKRKQKQKH